MRKKVLCVLLMISMLLPIAACTKPAAGVTDSASEITEPASSDDKGTVVQAEPEVDDLELIEEFIKNSEKPEDFAKEDLEAIYPYVSNRLYAVLSCATSEEDIDRWLELYDGMIVTVTYELAEIYHFERGLYPSVSFGVKVDSFKESANYENDDFSAVFRDTVFYTTDYMSHRMPIYITVKGRVDGSKKLKDAELVSWALEDKDRDSFEATKLDTAKELDDDSIIIDYDYIWSKYSDEIMTFDHPDGAADKLEFYTPTAEELAAAVVPEPVKLPFSNSTVGQVLTLMNDCNGQDLDTAVAMVEEFFDTELINTTTFTETRTNMETDEEMSWYYTVYYTRLYKDDLRFNRVNFAWNMDTGKVLRVELGVRNDEGDYAFSELDPLPDVAEASGVFDAFTDEVEAVCGDPYKSYNLCYDEDSYCNDYNYGSDCELELRLYNYTEDGGNGLVAFEIDFSNNSYLK